MHSSGGSLAVNSEWIAFASSDNFCHIASYALISSTVLKLLSIKYVRLSLTPSINSSKFLNSRLNSWAASTYPSFGLIPWGGAVGKSSLESKRITNKPIVRASNNTIAGNFLVCFYLGVRSYLPCIFSRPLFNSTILYYNVNQMSTTGV